MIHVCTPNVPIFTKLLGISMKIIVIRLKTNLPADNNEIFVTSHSHINYATSIKNLTIQ